VRLPADGRRLRQAIEASTKAHSNIQFGLVQFPTAKKVRRPDVVVADRASFQPLFNPIFFKNKKKNPQIRGGETPKSQLGVAPGEKSGAGNRGVFGSRPVERIPNRSPKGRLWRAGGK